MLLSPKEMDQKLWKWLKSLFKSFPKLLLVSERPWIWIAQNLWKFEFGFQLCSLGPFLLLLQAHWASFDYILCEHSVLSPQYLLGCMKGNVETGAILHVTCAIYLFSVEWHAIHKTVLANLIGQAWKPQQMLAIIETVLKCSRAHYPCPLYCYVEFWQGTDLR